MREEARSRFALVPLWMMVVAFVLPTYRACGTVYSPVSVATSDWGAAAWVLPPFLFALVFAVLSVHALSHQRVKLATRQAGLWALVLFAVSSVGGGVAIAVDSHHDWPILASATAAAVVAMLLVRTARGRTAWEVWERLLLGFAVLAAGTGPSLFLGEGLFTGHFEPLLAGAYVYLGSLAALLLLGAWSLMAGSAAPRRGRAATP